MGIEPSLALTKGVLDLQATGACSASFWLSYVSYLHLVTKNNFSVVEIIASREISCRCYTWEELRFLLLVALWPCVFLNGPRHAWPT